MPVCKCSHVVLTAVLAVKLPLACRQSGRKMEHYMNAGLVDMNLKYRTADCNGGFAQCFYAHHYPLTQTLNCANFVCLHQRGFFIGDIPKCE
ncbi:hypothetical protein TNCV_2666041 [Trichonephila clavipes]|nr:hypothetical protein TNCV_2666041 [Trichonephila clavipes]